MRRAPLCALLLFSAAYAGAQNTGVQLLEKFTKALNSAKTLTVTYTVQVVGGSSTAYKLELAEAELGEDRLADATHRCRRFENHDFRQGQEDLL